MEEDDGATEYAVPIVHLSGSADLPENSRDDVRGRGNGRRHTRGRGNGRGRIRRRDHSFDPNTESDALRKTRGRDGHGRGGMGDNSSRGQSRGGNSSRGQSRGGNSSRGQSRGGDFEGGGMRRWQSSEQVGASGGHHERAKGAKSDYELRPMGFRKLTELDSTERPEDVTLELTSPKTRNTFRLLLKLDSIKPDLINLLFKILEKVCRSTHKEGLMCILSDVCASPFMEKHIMAFLSDCLVPPYNIDICENIMRIMSLYETINERIPTSSATFIGSLALMKTVFEIQGLISTHPDLELKRSELFEACQQAALVVKEDSIKQQTTKRRRDVVKNADEDSPPDDFRSITLFPDVHEMGRDVFLRKNKDEGAYADLNTYLDVQFRLLREDYVQPLRKGIQEYKNCIKKGLAPKKMSDLRLYFDVHVMGSVCNEDVETRLKFDTSNTAKIRWQSSKRLIYGSLVGLTQDDFETIIFATVTNRNPKDLENGIIQVKFETGQEDITRASAKDSFIMAETTAYFEAYKHVLLRIQQMNDSMPFQKYIVSCREQVGPPSYLYESRTTQYNLQALGTGYSPPLQSVPILNTLRWPNASEVGLDSSQMEAVQTALTKELAIIQGPPGTGKTYVGLKIAKILFDNKQAWTSDGINTSILVVCYTNHALDQFLEGIAEFLDEGIVRVGGRSSSEKLKAFNLKDLRIEVRKERKLRRAVFENSLDCKRNMSTLRHEIEEVSSRIEASSAGILHEKVLQQFIAGGHYKDLTSRKNKNQNSVMQSWLGLDVPVAVSSEEQAKQTLIDHWVKMVIKYSMLYKSENIIVGEDAVDKLKIVLRVKLYQDWLLQFQNHIETQIEEIEDELPDDSDGSGNLTRQPELVEFEFHLEESKRGILSDIALRPFVPRHIFRAITTGKYSKYDEGHSVKTWLGASTLIILPGLTEAIRNLETSIEDAASVEVEEEADIITAQRVVDDDNTLFGSSSGPSAFLLTKAMESVAISMSSLDTDNEAKSNDDGTWEMQKQQKKKLKKQLEHILKSNVMMTSENAAKVTDVWSLDLTGRVSLYRYWVGMYQDSLKKSIEGREGEYRATAKRLKEVLMEEDKDILSQANVIGMTTTGAAKHANLLQAVAPKIIIVEEAAEVLESHIITNLNAKCQHLILIGDHQQLRPNPTVYELAKTYNLDISLFERLIKNKMHHVTLSSQHRMRPEVSVLMKHIYPNLQDHESVRRYPNVRGVEKDVFFIHHEYREEQQGETKSKTNEHEASFTVSLCKYFLQQGYKPSEITILAAYTGQILLIKRHMSKMADLFKGVRLTSVDNFQGEENRIILISFVRSNEEGSVGFLGVDNRVCVALSRAREGLYAVGNFKLMAKKSNLWYKIVQTLEEKKCIGLSLKLKCQNHPEVLTEIKQASDFDVAPEGGCSQPCNERLQCGHVCERICHHVDREHIVYKCKKPCPKPRTSCDHPCPKKCHEKCPPCKVPVPKTIPMCGHNEMISCSMDPHAVVCSQPCKEYLTCGHPCKGKCGDCRKRGHQKECKVAVVKMWPCGHSVTMECSKSNTIMKCPHPCTDVLSCNHKCQGTCGECLNGKVHKPCTKRCKKKLPCSHSCQQRCGAQCTPCTMTCTTSCPHSKCRDQCGKVCHPCKEPCTLECSHRTCSKLCSDKCDVAACSVPCEETVLPCLHKCISLCGEICICKECNVKKLQSGKTLPSEEVEIFIKLKSCGHIFSKDYLDLWMSAASSKYATLPTCPDQKCKKTIHDSKRYANILKVITKQIEDLKKDLWANTRRLDKRMKTLSEAIITATLPPVIRSSLQSGLARSSDDVNMLFCIENQFSLAQELYIVQSAAAFVSSTPSGSSLAKEVDSLMEHLLQRRDFVSDQMIAEYKVEINRLKLQLNQSQNLPVETFLP